MSSSSQPPPLPQRKLRPPLPPRPASYNNLPNQPHSHPSPVERPLPSSNPNIQYSNVSAPAHQSLGVSPYSSLPNSPNSSRLTGPRVMPEPGLRCQNAYNPGGFALSSPSLSSSPGYKASTISTSSLKHMPMPMPYLNVFSNTPTNPYNSSAPSSPSFNSSVTTNNTNPLPFSYNNVNPLPSTPNLTSPSSQKSDASSQNSMLSVHLTSPPLKAEFNQPRPTGPSKKPSLVISTPNNTPQNNTITVAVQEPKLSTVIPSDSEKTAIPSASTNPKVSSTSGSSTHSVSPNSSGQVSPNSRTNYPKKPTRQGTGYSFSQHANQIPPSYGSDGKLISSSSNSSKTNSPVRSNSSPQIKDLKNSPARLNSTSNNKPSEGAELDALDKSKLSDQGLLILNFTKRELRFVQRMQNLENLVTYRIQSGSIFVSENKEEVTELLLGSLPSLLTNHLEFIKDLIVHFEEEIKGDRIGGYSKIFLRRIEGFAKFLSFARCISQIREYVYTAQKNSPKFRQWLQELEESDVFEEKSLIENLESVNLQLNHYPSLLDEAKKASPDTSGADEMVFNAVIYAFEDLVADLTTLRFPLPSEDNSSYSSDSNETPVIDPEAMFWASAVSADVRDSIDSNEIKRQEAIFEFIKGEREYANDLSTIHNLFVNGIKKSPLLTSLQRDVVVHKLFFNYSDFMDLHLPMSKSLDKRQKESAVVNQIGDLLLSWSENLDPYKIYGARAQFATEFCTKERINNPKFSQFLRDCEQDKATRRLPIDSFISLPTRRLARYPLHFKEIRKRTPDDHPDAEALDTILTNLSTHLSIINQTKGETDSKLRLRAISDRLELLPQHKDNEHFALDLDQPERRLIKEGYLKFVKGAALIRVFLFDHCLLFTKEYELAEDLYEYQSFRKPIPLKDLTISGTVSAQTIQSHSSNGFFDSVFSSYSSNLPTPEICFSVVNSQSHQLFILAATIQSEKDVWLTAISEELGRFAEDDA